MVEQELEDGGHHDGEADHDGVAVVLPPPRGQVDAVIVAVHVTLVRCRGPGKLVGTMKN